jgi:hypothetical protein
MSKRKKLLEPQSLLYFSVHVILVLVGYFLFKLDESSTWLQGLGASLAGAGITGIVVFVYVLQQQDVRRQLEILSKLGVVDAFQARGTAIKGIYDDRLSKARQRIDILGFGQSTLREDYKDEFADWKARAVVRILLIDPGFPDTQYSYANQRDSEEQRESGSVEKEVKRFVRHTADLMDERFQVRLYRCLPSVNIFRVDDEIFWGPYLVRRVSRNSPTMVVNSSGEMFDVLAEHFDRIWSDGHLSVPVPEEWKSGND